jgi:hypothetical protein
MRIDRAMLFFKALFLRLVRSIIKHSIRLAYATMKFL